MKKEVVLIAFLMLILFSISSICAISIGVADGYVKYMNGSIISGASVSVAISGCSGEGCSGSTSTGSNGYYIIANLNPPKNVVGALSFTATKDGGTGSASGTADSSQVSHTNITLCYSPTSPSLTPVADTEDPSATFSWTSGTDPLGQSKHDEFDLDATPTNPASSPITINNLGFSSHTWKVRTCNNQCCSPWISDTFIVFCTPPSSPTNLTDIGSSHDTTQTVSWTSGTQIGIWPNTHDQFRKDSDPFVNQTSPETMLLTYTTHTWEVRTCNQYCCSTSASKTFTIGNSPPSQPTNANFTNYNATATTSLTWTSGIDPDGDIAFDEFQYENGTIISPATSPFNITSSILIKWKVRTCDVLGSCSNWTSIDSVTCSQVSSSCPTCPSCGGGGGGSGGSGGSSNGSSCNYTQTRVFCNGYEIKNISVSLIDLALSRGGNDNTLTIEGINFSMKHIKYCPWCYDNKKNYDEEAVDCGGSCPSCKKNELPSFLTQEEMPKQVFNTMLTLASISTICILLLICYGLFKLFKLKSKKDVMIKITQRKNLDEIKKGYKSINRARI